MRWCGAAIRVCECVSERATINCHGAYRSNVRQADNDVLTLYCRQQSASVFPGNWYSRSLLYWFVRATFAVCNVERVCACELRLHQSVDSTEVPYIFCSFRCRVLCHTYVLIVRLISTRNRWIFLWSSRTHTHKRAGEAVMKRQSIFMYLYMYGMKIVCLAKLLLCFVYARGYDFVLVLSQNRIIAL